MSNVMTDIMTDAEDYLSLSAEDIIVWLRDHPDFLREHPEVCDLLVAPKAVSGKGVVDFQHFMVQRLREDRDGIVEEVREFVENSRANMSNQARIHAAILMILEARNFEDFIHVLVMDFVAILDLDIMALIIEVEGDVVPHINMPGVYVVEAGSIKTLMKDKSILLESHIEGAKTIYGGAAGLVNSQALLRLNIGRGSSCSLLAFGSRAPEMFSSGQGTEMIVFLGHVIERCFRKWLDLPSC